MPKRTAAPFEPPTTQSVSRRRKKMCSRSASASVTAAAGAPLATVVALSGCRLQVARRNLKRWSGRENHRSLDNILQLTYIARPAVLHQSIHDGGWDGFNRRPIRRANC